MYSLFIGVAIGATGAGLIFFIIFYKKIFRPSAIVFDNSKKKTVKKADDQNIDLSQFKDITYSLEMERRRIGSDLHDELNAPLMRIKLNLESVMLEASSLSPLAESKLSDAIFFLEKLSLTIRSVLKGLIPDELLAGDLHSAIKTLCSKISSNKGTKIKFETSGEVIPFNEEQNVNIYRIVQELLNNAAKHSLAWNIEVSLTWSMTHLKVIVKDDGIGYTESESKGMGLAGIQMKAIALGASYKFSSPGRGTEFELVVPIFSESCHDEVLDHPKDLPAH